MAISLEFLEYYDKYGAPMSKEKSWEEGYHVVERKLADYYNTIVDNKLDFPLIAGMGGGVHLYKQLHGRMEDQPWNWTGWIPRQNRWLSQGTFFSNRFVQWHRHRKKTRADTLEVKCSPGKTLKN